MATALIWIVYIELALAITMTIAVGLYRGRRHIRWRNPGYNIFTGEWSDEPEHDEKSDR